LKLVTLEHPGTLEHWNPSRTLDNPGQPWNLGTLEPWNLGTLDPLKLVTLTHCRAVLCSIQGGFEKLFETTFPL